MCLSIKSGPHVARAKFYVLKYVYMHYDNKSFHTPFMGYNWELGKMMEADISRIPGIVDKSKGRIENGIHAYTVYYEEMATILAETNTFSCIVFSQCYSCILIAEIPQGSKFYLGTSGDIVANMLLPIKHLIRAIDLPEQKISFDEAFLMSTGIAKKEKYNLIPMK